MSCPLKPPTAAIHHPAYLSGMQTLAEQFDTTSKPFHDPNFNRNWNYERTAKIEPIHEPIIPVVHATAIRHRYQAASAWQASQQSAAPLSLEVDSSLLLGSNSSVVGSTSTVSTVGGANTPLCLAAALLTGSCF